MDRRTPLALDPPAPQNPRDMQASDNRVPLSPQWLLPKPGPGDNKEFSSTHGTRHDALRLPGNGDDLGKKKEAFRPSFLDIESGRRDRWHEEERETNSAVRRDRWRDGDKEPGEIRKMDRWSETPKHSVEGRRAVPERWNDSGNKDGDLRKDSKWSTRWGPDDKESESLHEKWTDSNKDDVPRDKGILPFSSHDKETNNHGKEAEKEDHYSRPWRGHSYAGRGRGDSFNQQSQVPSKQSAVFGHGRGKTESASSVSAAGRGRFSSSANVGSSNVTRSHHFGGSFDKSNRSSGDPSIVKYSRMKLLDIYRSTDMKSYELLLEGLHEVASLTQDEPLEPLALSAPTPDESVILKGIDKGDIVSSGAPQVSKDGSVGRTAVDAVPSRHRKLGSTEESPTVGNVYKDANIYDSDGKDSVPPGMDATPPSRSLLLHTSPEELTLYYRDPQGQIQGPFSGSDLIGWFEAGYFGIDLPVKLASSPVDTPFSSLGDVMPHLRMKARAPPGFNVAKQSDILEESLRIKLDSSGAVHQGFSDFEAQNNGPKTTHDSATEAQNRLLESFMSGEVLNSSTKENFSLSRGMQDYGGNGSGIVSSFGGESGNNMNYLLAQTRLLERQRSIPNALPLWSNKDVSSLMPKIDSMPNSTTTQSQHLSASDPTHQPLQSPQHIDVMSLLHSAADKAQPSGVNSGASLWSNFSDARVPSNNIHGGIELKDAIGVQHNQHVTPQYGFGMQQVLQKANQPSLPHFANQSGDLSSSFGLPEKMPVSDVSQDPRVLSLLQQQYLLSQLQLHSHAPVPTQLSVLDKILLLQQQLKQEQQQQQQHMLMQQQQQQMLMQQQQHLLSQVLSGHQPLQHFADPSYGLGRTTMPDGNMPMEQLGPQRMHEGYVNQQMPSSKLHTGQPSFLPVRNAENNQNVGSIDSGPSSIHLPHQIFNQIADSRTAVASLLPADDEILNSSASETATMLDSLAMSYGINDSEQVLDTENSSQYLENVETKHHFQSISQTSQVSLPFAPGMQQNLEVVKDAQRSSDFVSSATDQVQDMKISEENISEPPAETRDAKKTSEKKSRKQKKSKAEAPSDLGKELHKTGSSKKNVGHGLEVLTGGNSVGIESVHALDDSHGSPWNSSIPISADEPQIVEAETETVTSGKQAPNQQTSSVSRAWKPAPGFRPKSLLEIQQEEQLKALRETERPEVTPILPPASAPIPTPWTGLAANMENKSNRDSIQGSNIADVSGNSDINSKSKKSQLHDLLAGEVLAENKETEIGNSASNVKVSSFPPPSPASSQAEISLALADDFIDAKDTRKNRKKTSKSKVAGAKSPSPVGSADISSLQAINEKGKTTRQMQQEKDSLPAPSAGPSLADFVPWKGEQATSTPAPAWSVDSGKAQRQTSLRDILREQEKVTVSVQPQVPMPVPSKVQSTRPSRSTWQVTGSSPTDSQMSLHGSGHSKLKAEDDLFWGPPEQSKPERKQSDFPSPASPGTGVKGTAPKAISGSANRQRSFGGRPSEQALSPANSVLLSSKGKTDASVKKSEAMDFRDWCESEWIRMTGTNDTSFLEFCIKQSTSEAEMLLRENLGTLDRNQEFIDKFLNYKDFLSSDVIEIAFQGKKSGRIYSGGHVRPENSSVTTNRNAVGIEDEPDSHAKGGAKKKGKKGQKVSPLVLGFNVVSNRIMMGEIQNVED